MTSEATLLTKEELKHGGFVEHQLPTPLQKGEQKRWLYVTEEIEEILCDGGAVPKGWTDARIGSFLKGHILLVMQQRSRKKIVADMKRLEGHDEAWVMVFPLPKNEQWRLFGRFADKDTFVGLLFLPRKECGPDELYQQRAEEMIAEWPFDTDPLRGDFPDDYLTGTVIKDET